MIVIAIALVVCLFGGVVFLLTEKKAKWLGLAAFGFGLLVTVQSVNGSVTAEAHPSAATHGR